MSTARSSRTWSSANSNAKQQAACSVSVKAVEAIVTSGVVTRRHAEDDDDETDGRFDDVVLPPDLLDRGSALLEQLHRLPQEDPKLERLIELVEDTLGDPDRPVSC